MNLFANFVTVDTLWILLLSLLLLLLLFSTVLPCPLPVALLNVCITLLLLLAYLFPPSVVPFQLCNLKIRRIRNQQFGMLATRMAVLASRMYQKVQLGAYGWAKE